MPWSPYLPHGPTNVEVLGRSILVAYVGIVIEAHSNDPTHVASPSRSSSRCVAVTLRTRGPSQGFPLVVVTALLGLAKLRSIKVHFEERHHFTANETACSHRWRTATMVRAPGTSAVTRRFLAFVDLLEP